MTPLTPQPPLKSLNLKIYTESSTDSIFNLQNHLNLIHRWSVNELQISRLSTHTRPPGQTLFISPISIASSIVESPLNLNFKKTHPWHCCTSQTTGFYMMLHFTQTSEYQSDLDCYSRACLTQIALKLNAGQSASLLLELVMKKKAVQLQSLEHRRLLYRSTLSTV